MVDNIDKSLDLGGKPELEILKSDTEVEIDGQPIPTPEGLDIQIEEDGGCRRFTRGGAGDSPP